MDIMLKNILDLIDSNYQKDEDFEKEFGVAKSTVSAWRRGKLMSYKKYATSIASFFNVSSDWISGNEQKNKPAAQSDRLSQEEIELLRAFRSQSKSVQDVILRAAGVDPDTIPADK